MLASSLFILFLSASRDLPIKINKYINQYTYHIEHMHQNLKMLLQEANFIGYRILGKHDSSCYKGCTDVGSNHSMDA